MFARGSDVFGKIEPKISAKMIFICQKLALILFFFSDIRRLHPLKLFSWRSFTIVKTSAAGTSS